MKAIQIKVTGGPEVLELVDIAKPAPAPGEVLVRSVAIGVGKPDVLMRTGAYRWMPPLPATPGAEMAGIVEALGDGVAAQHPQLKVGVPVLVYHFGGRCYAEFAAVPAADVTPLPETIDLDAAVSIPNYQVAWALMHRAARGVDIRSVYVNGAAGGIGSAVIQLCKVAGFKVIGGAGSAAKCAFAMAQGATHAIDYSSERVVDRVLELSAGEGVDLILDHIVGKNFTDSLDMLGNMGMIVSFNALGGTPEKELFREMRAHLPKSPAVRCFTMHAYDHDPVGKRHVRDTVIDLFARGMVNPPIHDRLPLGQARLAHELLDARAVMGKLLLKP
jgi:NADPH2:quinone reductase